MTATEFPRLGCIADDLTGAVDLASRFQDLGFRVHLRFQALENTTAPNADILIVGLKSRMKPVREAVAEFLLSLEWLSSQGCTMYYVKYASTFDSTEAGNIGPVIDAAMSRLGIDFTVACPALPSAGRTTKGGQHFVDGIPLGESYMRFHPLTPMRNSYLVPVLQGQTRQHVGLLPHSTVTRSASFVRYGLDQLKKYGYGIAILDAVTDDDLDRIAEACANAQLITGSSGLAVALMRNRRGINTLPRSANYRVFAARHGMQAVISGSCSEITRIQVAAAAQRFPMMQIDPLALVAARQRRRRRYVELGF